jgi:beta-galactosidase
MITPKSLRALACLFIMSSAVALAEQPVTQIRSGEVWKDTEGRPVNAHGGGLLHHEGTYFWYGEIKEGKTYLPEVNASWGGTRVDVVGVSCYSSKDLLNWKFEGNVLPAKPGTDLDPKVVLERPKVVYNAKTKKFVMWFHSDSLNYAAARYGVAVSDSPTGVFTYLGSARPHAEIWPTNITEAQKADKDSALVRDFAKGQMVRDLTVFVDDDGRPIFSRRRRTIRRCTSPSSRTIT